MRNKNNINMRSAIFNILFAALLLLANISSLRAEDLGTEGDAPSMGDIPVDGGLSLLLAAGAAYGVRRVHRKKGSYKKYK
jgi:hypothetical protein